MKHAGSDFRHKITRWAVCATMRDADRPTMAGHQNLCEFLHRLIVLVLCHTAGRSTWARAPGDVGFCRNTTSHQTLSHNHQLSATFSEDPTPISIKSYVGYKTVSKSRVSLSVLHQAKIKQVALVHSSDKLLYLAQWGPKPTTLK
jgi:hypothetical protein